MEGTPKTAHTIPIIKQIFSTLIAGDGEKKHMISRRPVSMPQI